MKSPITGKEMKLKKEIRSLIFRKEAYNVTYHYYLCEDSKEQFTTTPLDELNLNQLHNQYREAHRLPFPDEIKAIRGKYGLSAIKMAEILGFGANVYRNYENGEVPNESNARLIQLANNPSQFKSLVEISMALSFDEQTKLIKHIHSLIEKDNENIFTSNIKEYLLGSKLPDILTGYKVPSIEKITEMVVYFSQVLEPWKTKLNKLLFYADFLHFKKTGYSISGVRYRAINMGPVPNNFDSIFEFIENNNDIIIQHTVFPNGKSGDQFIHNKNRKFNATVFTDDEFATLKLVTECFNKTEVNDIIDISHKENAWLKNYDSGKQLIKYDYGFELMAV